MRFRITKSLVVDTRYVLGDPVNLTGQCHVILGRLGEIFSFSQV